jgi:transposase
MDMSNLTLITLVWELYQQGVPKSRIAMRLKKNRETVHLWIKGIEEQGLLAFLRSCEQAKKGQRTGRQVDALVKRWVWELREREAQCCGQKIAYFLEREHGVHLSVPKIYEILREKYVLRSKWKKNQVRGPVPEATAPRQVVQMDSIDFGGLFAFTGIDIYTREADIRIAPALTAAQGRVFLEQAMRRRFGGHVALIQTDGGSEFKEAFAEQVHVYCDRHRVARPYKKNEQAYIESFNRTVRKECLGWQKYRATDLPACREAVEAFLERYHYHRPHLGLGLHTPLTKGA